MFLTLTTTGTPDRPASDLGFLLHKHPDKAQEFSTSFGTAHVVYPEAGEQRCTAALLLEVDTVALVRRGRGKGRGGAPDAALAQYVNDRPYAASSLLAVALGKVFSSAMRGVCATRPERAAAPLPLRVEVPALPARGGPRLVRRLFEPLGWAVTAEPVPLDTRFPDWGDSRYVRLVLESDALTLSEALRHLYVLLPVLDGAKHYWVSADEVDKLLRAGGAWLHRHPEMRLITSRFLARRWSLTREAMERLELVRLAEADDIGVEEIDNAVAEETEEEARPTPLAVLRREAILAVLREAAAARVLDLGCGEGHLVRELLKEPRFTEIVGMDVSVRALTIASRRLRPERMGERQAARVALLQGSLAYTDKRLKGYDAAVLSEVVEHVDPPRLPALEYAVFGAARPRTVVVTTPNAEYNVRWESLPAGQVRHRDHRFEWTRGEFRAWAAAVAERHGYGVGFRPVGTEDPEVGPPTQMAVFTLAPGTPDPHRAGAHRATSPVPDPLAVPEAPTAPGSVPAPGTAAGPPGSGPAPAAAPDDGTARTHATAETPGAVRSAGTVPVTRVPRAITRVPRSTRVPRTIRIPRTPETEREAPAA
ncbi:3' terminal RNA ribose 2'-O-methyltransferase Hen1 [Streptomyces sp. SID8352]|uniref:3' terminal RNA ribose 2'-O-methyltransferase Hen1 n=1 Tax=Streptomyces sp. SID8352 TaxID=2690338 RepID=UPI001EFFF4E5|nr:3' terminal RNA ribose 2'-O-methyltransferase Hen1 [Streptomyces sp. SID8352]